MGVVGILEAKPRVGVLGLNCAILVLFYESIIHPAPLTATILLAGALCAAPLSYLYLRRGSPTFSKKVAVALIGSALVWMPVFLGAYTYIGPFPAMMDKLIDLSMWTGMTLWVVSALLRSGRDEVSQRGL